MNNNQQVKLEKDQLEQIMIIYDKLKNEIFKKETDIFFVDSAMSASLLNGAINLYIYLK